MSALTPLPSTSFRLTALDLRILERVRSRLGLATRSEALRHLLREWARLHDGRLLEGGK